MVGSDAFVYFIFVLYAVSLAAAFEAAHSFSVLGYGEMMILGVALFTGPVIVAFHVFKESERFGVAAAHVFLAIVFHPAVTFKDPLILDIAEQTQLLRRISDSKESWWVTAELAHDLARSLKDESALRLEISSPLLYWMFPPSLALAVWGVAWFFLLPRGRSSERT
jgi:hypothetical protein